MEVHVFSGEEACCATTRSFWEGGLHLSFRPDFLCRGCLARRDAKSHVESGKAASACATFAQHDGGFEPTGVPAPTPPFTRGAAGDGAGGGDTAHAARDGVQAPDGGHDATLAWPRARGSPTPRFTLFSFFLSLSIPLSSSDDELFRCFLGLPCSQWAGWNSQNLHTSLFFFADTQTVPASRNQILRRTADVGDLGGRFTFPALPPRRAPPVPDGHRQPPHGRPAGPHRAGAAAVLPAGLRQPRGHAAVLRRPAGQRGGAALPPRGPSLLGRPALGRQEWPKCFPDLADETYFVRRSTIC